jgi:PAS domain S-box-containing protein
MDESIKLEILKTKLNLYARAMSSSSCGITIADARLPDMPLIYVNDAFEKICGYNKDEVIGRNCRFLQGNFRDEKVIEQIHHAINHREHLQVMLKNFRKDGTLFWNELNLSPVFDEEGILTHFVGIQTDVTEREEVKAQNIQHTKDLEQASKELKELNKNKDRLLGIVAHDLRSPLAAIVSSIELVSVTNDKNERDELLNLATESAYKMLDLVNDLLDVSAIKTGKLEIKKQQIDLKSYFDSIAKSCTRNASLKGINFELSTRFDKPEFSLDPNRIEQVITNLVGNAIKFSNRGTTITLTVTSTKEHLIIKVKDQGLGIPEDELPNIFGEFTDISTKPTENEKSSGLGLSICKRITELHGGSISVKSKPKEGSTFKVILES